MTPIRAGKLNKRIIIQTYTEAANTYGESVRTWVDVGTRWASVEPLTMREFINAKQLSSQIDIRFVTRYLSGIKPKMRVVYNNENYNIESVINIDNKNRELQLLCSRTI